ncbi:hypothetical protein DPMN_144863 [Dreissena polymorpha]|uniref:Uncharacterized protein n=1 Tax=Dreissena polymorpha TaxID=45954 RepID=A0A9D4F3X4_DREPO|nr:hypothetical protein DPMN_144863 [Dreissena polymorpha]
MFSVPPVILETSNTEHRVHSSQRGHSSIGFILNTGPSCFQFPQSTWKPTTQSSQFSTWTQ